MKDRTKDFMFFGLLSLAVVLLVASWSHHDSRLALLATSAALSARYFNKYLTRKK